MKQFELDGRYCRDRESFCTRLIALLRLPDSCGKNLDALHDCLTDQSGGVLIAVAHTSALRKKLAKRYDSLIRLLKDVQLCCPDIRVIGIAE
jgi:RNAse (barnase) inhibitor barstar